MASSPPPQKINHQQDLVLCLLHSCNELLFLSLFFNISFPSLLETLDRLASPYRPHTPFTARAPVCSCRLSSLFSLQLQALCAARRESVSAATRSAAQSSTTTNLARLASPHLASPLLLYESTCPSAQPCHRTTLHNKYTNTQIPSAAGFQFYPRPSRFCLLFNRLAKLMHHHLLLHRPNASPRPCDIDSTLNSTAHVALNRPAHDTTPAAAPAPPPTPACNAATKQ